MKARTLAALLLVLPAAAGAQPPPPAADLQTLAAMIDAGQLAAAAKDLQRLLELGDSPVARDLLGVALVGQGRLEEAEREFRQAILLQPDLFPPRKHLSRLLLKQGRGEEALAELRAAARLGPLPKDLTLQLAAGEAATGNTAAAEAQLESASERFDSVRALLELARLRSRRGDSPGATQSLWRALQMAPNSEEVLSAYAEVALGARAPVPAIRALEQLTRMHPEVARYLYLLGVGLMQIGEGDASVEALERSLEVEPHRDLTLIALGLTLNSQKRFAAAETALLDALQLDPDHPEALAALAEAEEGLGKLEASERHAARCLAKVPGHARALLVLGKVRMTQERHAEARDELLRSIAVDPTSHKAHYQLSLAYARLGDTERSQHHLELYRDGYEKAEERLIELRTQAGLSVEGM